MQGSLGFSSTFGFGQLQDNIIQDLVWLAVGLSNFNRYSLHSINSNITIVNASYTTGIKLQSTFLVSISSWLFDELSLLPTFWIPMGPYFNIKSDIWSSFWEISTHLQHQSHATHSSWIKLILLSSHLHQVYCIMYLYRVSTLPFGYQRGQALARFGVDFLKNLKAYISQHQSSYIQFCFWQLYFRMLALNNNLAS